MADLTSHPFADPKIWERLIDGMASRLGRDVATALGEHLARALTEDASAAATVIGADVEERFRPLRADLERAVEILGSLQEIDLTLQRTIATIGPQIEGAGTAVVARFDRDLEERAEALAAFDLVGLEGANRLLARDAVARCVVDAGKARVRAAAAAERLWRLRDELNLLTKSRSGVFGWGIPTDTRAILDEIVAKVGAAADELAETGDVLAHLESTVATLAAVLGQGRTDDYGSDRREDSR